MEAVPRLPMLSFDLKVSPEATSFGPKLKQYIRDVYHEDSETYSHEIHTLESLRAAAVCSVRDVTGCSALKRYYCQLHFLQSRFPMAKDGAAAVPFTWRDIYAGMVCTLADIRFEMVAILYNIGALHSHLGASESRVTGDGMKLSCTHFQCAAWAFQHLKDTFPQPAGVDLAPDVMQFMYHLCLAQAQECILEKSMMDNRKATIIAKVAVQIVDYYNLAANTLDLISSDECSVSEILGAKIYKKWKRYVKFKIAYHSCVSLLYQGQQAEEQQKMGERVAFYQAASEKLEEATKCSKGMDNIEDINEALAFTMDVVEGKKKAAKNENEFIYHEEVPDKDALPDVKGASLVKGIPFNVNDPEMSGPDIFARLVPMKAHEASSLYSEEKAKLLRRVGAMVDEKDQELVTFMASLQLDHLNIYSEPDRLPQELVDRCAALSAKPHMSQTLEESMKKLEDTYHDVETMLQYIDALIEREEKRETEYQNVMGKRPPSIVATDLKREANKYQEAHAKASESNQTLHKAMALHVGNLEVMSRPLDALQKIIPSLTGRNTGIDESSVREMQRLVGKVEEMKQQRAMLATQLRESTCQDDITRQLVTRTGESLDTIFSQEMQKHQRYVSLIEQNLAAQDNILKALTEAYARYARTRKITNEIIRQREGTVSSLVSSYDAYEDLIAKSSKGLEFYRKLETNVNKLLQRVKSTCKVQDEEREQILTKNKKTLPSAHTVTEKERSAADSPVPSSGAPKLKDYLANMKQGTTGYVSGYPSVSVGQVSDTYYNTYHQVPTPVTSLQPSSCYDHSGPSSQLPAECSKLQQWVPAIRPAPLGSEGTSEQTATVKPETSESKAPLPQQTYSYSAPTVPLDAGLKPVTGHLPTTFAGYNSTQYSYANPSTYSVSPSPYIHQQQDSAFTQESGNSQGYSHGSMSYMQQYNTSGQGVAASYVTRDTGTAGSSMSSYSTDANPYVNQGGIPQHASPYTADLSQQYHALQPTYQQGGTVYPSGTGAAYLSADQQPQDGGTYYMTAASHQGYSAGTYATVQQAYPTLSIHQMPASSAVSSTLSQAYSASPQTQLPSISSGPTYDATTATFQYESNSQNTQGGFRGQADAAQTHHMVWHQQPQEPVYGGSSSSSTSAVTACTASATSNSTPYYSSELNASTSTPSGGSPSVVPLSNQQYYGNIQQQFQSSYSYPTMSSGYSSQQTAQVQPNISASALSSQFQYMAVGGVSCYTNAGSYVTAQTCSSQTSVDGHTFASQYSTSQGVSSYQNPVYSQVSYYSLPYGYQYDTDGVVGNSPQGVPHVPQDVYTGSTVVNQVPQSPMTYMQARGQNDSTTTTFSQQGGSSVSSSSVQALTGDGSEDISSNVDLLAGLDFTLNQAPLVPQQPVTTAWQTDELAMKSATSNIQHQTSTSSSLHIPSTVAVTEKTDLSSGSSSSEPDAAASQLPQINGSEAEKDSSQQMLVSKLELPKGSSNQEEEKLTPKTFGKDPYTDPEALNQFVQEVGKYEKFVEGLTTKTLNGPTPLDMKWKELLELQEKDAHKRSISVARCYPMKNRFPDILPYDHSRIELPSTKDDYINASYIKNLTPLAPPFIVTQAPLPSTYTDFWTMVWEQQVEVIVCLLSDSELDGQVYWPVEKGQELAMGKMKLTLQSSNARSHWIERIVSVCVTESRATRVIVHLQFSAWPGSSFPASPGPFLSFVSETLNFYSQQRGACHPVVVHCLSGVGRTGLFCLVTAAVCDIQAGHGLLDLVATTACMSTHRKGSLRDREHLKFAYQAVLYYAQDLLMKRGILTSRSTFDDKRSRGGKSHTRHPSEDFLLGPPTDLSQLQSGIEKMGCNKQQHQQQQQ